LVCCVPNLFSCSMCLPCRPPARHEKLAILPSGVQSRHCVAHLHAPQIGFLSEAQQATKSAAADPLPYRFTNFGKALFHVRYIVLVLLQCSIAFSADLDHWKEPSTAPPLSYPTRLTSNNDAPPKPRPDQTSMCT
jgi:hypothetical protein